MTIAWLQLCVAGLFEVGWAMALKRTDGFDVRHRPLACALTVVLIVASLGLLSLAVRTIPIGTGYAVWTGIGALGAVVLGALVYGEPATPSRLACLTMLIAGIVGLQLTSSVARAAPATTQANAMNTIYIGTYTNGTSEGIYRATFDPATGAIGAPTLAAKTPNPSYLAVAPGGRLLYAVAEVDSFNAQKSGALAAFAIEADGALREIDRQASGGAGPCYVSVAPDAKSAFVANYGGGSVAMLPIGDDGALQPASSVEQHVGKSIDPKRQDRPYAHSVRPDANGAFAVACDLGTDEVIVYRIAGNAMTRAAVTKLPPGSGPRHAAFSPDGESLYVVNELANTVARFAWDATTGSMTPQQTISTLPADLQGSNTTAEIMVHPSGRFVFASNRGDDSIAVFAVDPTTGALATPRQFKTNGSSPRNFVIDPTGRWLIASNQKSDTIVTFAIDAANGALTLVGQPVMLASPCCVRFVP